MATNMRSNRSRKFKFEINVVPYVDVMLVLVVILMVAAPMSNPSVINLPNAGPSKQAPADYLEIAIKQDGTITVGKHGETKTESDTSRDVVERLRQLHTAEPELPLLIAADKEIKYDDVIQMIAAAKKVGIARVGLATK